MVNEVQTTRTVKHRRQFVLLGICAAIAVAVFAAVPRAEPAEGDPCEQAVVALEKDGVRYEFHVLTGTESLLDVRDDPDSLVNVLRGRESEAASLRRELEGKLGVSTLESLRARHAEAIRRLQALGYL